MTFCFLDQNDKKNNSAFALCSQNSSPVCELYLWLTAFDGVGGSLQGHRPAIGLVDVHSKYQSHACVFAANVCLSLAKLDVGVPQLQYPGTVDSEAERQEFRI